MKKLFVILVLLLAIPFAFAEITEEQLQMAKSLEGQQLPEIAQKLFAKNEVINVYMGENQKFQVNIQSYIIMAVEEGLNPKPTIDLKITESGFEKLTTTQDLKTTLTELLDSKDLKLEPHGFFKSIKFGLAKWVATTFL
ncbi:MAG: hypothetical protein Q8P15_00240 [Nanoarchaeota archaeon]|nr:hypothetical protein [Nanoarchaeota archaeon]